MAAAHSHPGEASPCAPCASNSRPKDTPSQGDGHEVFSRASSDEKEQSRPTRQRQRPKDKRYGQAKRTRRVDNASMNASSSWEFQSNLLSSLRRCLYGVPSGGLFTVLTHPART